MGDPGPRLDRRGGRGGVVARLDRSAPAPRHRQLPSALGWTAVLALPQLLGKLQPAPLVLLAGGGLLYSVGAIVYARQRPDPWPRWFGFHEIFHALVIAAAAAQYAALVGWLLPSAGA